MENRKPVIEKLMVVSTEHINEEDFNAIRNLNGDVLSFLPNVEDQGYGLFMYVDDDILINKTFSDRVLEIVQYAVDNEIAWIRFSVGYPACSLFKSYNW